MLRGSCLCGGVRYEISGPLAGALNCHCSMCRKAQGAAFRSRARVKAEDFRWVAGESLITWYESSSGTHRGFCGVCGAPMLSRFDFDASHYGLPLGALDDDPGVRPKFHVFTANKAPWFEITDALAQYPALPDPTLPKCLRCEGIRLVKGAPESDDIEFFDCPACFRRYARKPNGALTYRWLHPVSLALYGVIFERDPLPHAERIARDLGQSRSGEQRLVLLEEIELEVQQPTQQVRDILDNVASEADCRVFLAAVVAHLRALQ